MLFKRAELWTAPQGKGGKVSMPAGLDSPVPPPPHTPFVLEALD